LIRLDVNKTRKYWDQLQAELKEGTAELETWSLQPKGGSFYARAASDRVMIEGKGIKGIRMIAFPEFEKGAKYYNDYIDEAVGVKQKMRDEIGYNTTYILTLIHHAIETEPTGPAPAPAAPKKVVPEPVRHYRSRRGN